MLLNYLKLASRLLLRNPFFSFLNILGLSLGFAAFLVLWQYTSNELKTDQFHVDYKNKMRLVFTWKTRDEEGTVPEYVNGLFAARFAKVLLSDYEDFETYCRIYHQVDFSVQALGDHGKDIVLSHVNAEQEDVAFKEVNLVYADPNLFEFFSIPLVEGNSKTALEEPSSIVISESMARKYFGKENAVNRSLYLNDSASLKVTGVFKDLPHNTHLTFGAVVSMKRIFRQIDDINKNVGATIYFQKKSNATRLDEKVDISAKKFLAPAIASLKLDPNDLKFFFQPLEEIGFSQLRGDIHQHRSRTILIALRIVSIVILVTAWINYLNMVI
jgi:putative ABC transport system permease protein